MTRIARSETPAASGSVLIEPVGMWSRVAAGTSPEGLEWLRQATSELWSQPADIHVRFPMVSRKLGRAPLDADAAPGDPHAWMLDDAGRTLLLRALGDGVLDELGELYRYGDAAERRGILRALPHLPVGDRAVWIVEDAIRTNDTSLIAAALGPYATAHLSDAAYDQAVLKCAFVGVSLLPLHGLARVTPNGARMLAALVHERVAAGRDVDRELWEVIDRHRPAAELAAIEAELDSPFADRRAAAERALEGRR
jgi:hypothetical protein